MTSVKLQKNQRASKNVKVRRSVPLSGSLVHGLSVPSNVAVEPEAARSSAWEPKESPKSKTVKRTKFSSAMKTATLTLASTMNFFLLIQQANHSRKMTRVMSSVTKITMKALLRPQLLTIV